MAGPSVASTKCAQRSGPSCGMRSSSASAPGRLRKREEVVGLRVALGGDLDSALDALVGAGAADHLNDERTLAERHLDADGGDRSVEEVGERLNVGRPRAAVGRAAGAVERVREVQ